MTPDFPQFNHVLGPMKPRRKPNNRHKTRRQFTLSNLEKVLSPLLPAGSIDTSLCKHQRKRLLFADLTFWSWLWQLFQANTSCREVVRQLQMLIGLSGLTCDEGSSAYCQARSKITLGFLRTMIVKTAQAAERLSPKRGILKNRPLRAMDGSSARLPDLPTIRKEYFQPTSQKEGAGFPVIKFCALFCVHTGVILAHMTGDLFKSEISLAGRLLKHLKKGDVIISDRGFCNYVLLWVMQSLGVDSIVRVSALVRHIDFRKAKTLLGPDDGIFEWKKPLVKPKWVSTALWARVPDQLRVRVIRYQIKKKKSRVKSIVLATTLLDPKDYPAAEVGQAFGLRWREEMAFDDIKTTMEMAHLKCRSPEMVRKELAMFLIVHNFIRCLMLKAAQQQNVPVESISFKGTMDAFRQCCVGMVQAKSKASREFLFRIFLGALAADALPHRPDRREPRAVKRIIKYPKLTCHRHKFEDVPARSKRRSAARKRTVVPI
jgi:hypothetical protein